MASRRTRIKGLANIPQRRKNNESLEPTVKNETDNLTFNSEKIIIKNEPQHEPRSNTDENPSEQLISCFSESDIDSKTNNTGISQNDLVVDAKPKDTIVIFPSSNVIIADCNINNEISNENGSKKAIKLKNNINLEHETNENASKYTMAGQNNENTKCEIENELIEPHILKQASNPILTCRKFIKPVVSASIVNRNSGKSTDEESANIHTVPMEKEGNEEPPTEKYKTEKKPLLMRRKFIKPIISSSVINRKFKQDADKECVNGDDFKAEVEAEPMEIEKIENLPTEKEKTKKIIILDKVIIPPPPKNTLTSYSNIVENGDLKQPITTSIISCGNELTLNETHLTPQNSMLGKPEVPLDKGVKKLTPHINAQNSDTEYPPPPPSPSKINRSRIKAIPRLSYRKTSFSASESEDESRKNYNRNRNDSVCSAASGVHESIAECMSPQRPKEVTSVQKKTVRSESSRKLYEARHDFYRRFGTDKPDRQRLTMMDLIFYNPASNPMTNEVKSKQDKTEEEEIIIDSQGDKESEKIDDPQMENEDTDRTVEENEMPVPQIKIGPSGEIILDEQSLVIESKEVKKQREDLQKTKLVNGDLDTGYGIYKRQKRSKDWTDRETFRFYKALNTIGTDFYLMCELFPRRTRRELKIKFKKEEKINRSLIDKAIMQPCSFDFMELKHEVDMEEKEWEELQRQKEEEMKMKLEKSKGKQVSKRKASQISTNEENPKPVKSAKPKPPKIRKVRKPRKRKLNIENILENSDADESDIATQSESDDEISMPLKATRSGRIPKVSRKYDHSECMSIENIMRANKIRESTKTNNIEPGSIMIITEKGPNGEPVYKIFMVTPDQNATPLNLTSEAVLKALEFKKGVSAQNILTISANVTDDESENNIVHEENNVTIPADENVTSLKSNGDFSSRTIKSDDGIPVENNVTIPAIEAITLPVDENITVPADETLPAKASVAILPSDCLN